MTVKEKLREWAGMKELYNKPEKPRIVIGYSCAADLPEKLERLLRSVDERAFGAGMCHRTPLEGQSTPAKRILKALEEQKDE